MSTVPPSLKGTMVDIRSKTQTGGPRSDSEVMSGVCSTLLWDRTVVQFPHEGKL